MQLGQLELWGSDHSKEQTQMCAVYMYVYKYI